MSKVNETKLILKKRLDKLERYYVSLKEALNDLKFCIESFNKLEEYYLNSVNFAKRYIMRLEKRIIDKLKQAVYNSFGDVNIYLFGSRTDDTKKGGDIDIAIDTNLSRLEFRKSKAKFISNLIKDNFELKIDVFNYNTTDKFLYDNIRNSALKI